MVVGGPPSTGLGVVGVEEESSSDATHSHNRENDEEYAVPIPIQTFLWRQTCPFIRPKLGKLHEATCVV
jgi:hypothetical protein